MMHTRAVLTARYLRATYTIGMPRTRTSGVCSEALPAGLCFNAFSSCVLSILLDAARIFNPPAWYATFSSLRKWDTIKLNLASSHTTLTHNMQNRAFCATVDSSHIQAHDSRVVQEQVFRTRCCRFVVHIHDSTSQPCFLLHERLCVCGVGPGTVE